MSDAYSVLTLLLENRTVSDQCIRVLQSQKSRTERLGMIHACQSVFLQMMAFDAFLRWKGSTSLDWPAALLPFQQVKLMINSKVQDNVRGTCMCIL